MNVSNSTGVESSNSVRRPKSKDTKSEDRVLKNTNDMRPSAHVRKMSSSVSIDSNKRETMHSNVCQSNASVLNTKTVNAINDGSNIVSVSYGKDVFLLSHEKCVARYALSRDSKVKRVLFTTPIVARSKNLRAISVVAKSRLSVAKTPTATNKSASGMITLQQSLDKEIMFKAISRYVTYTMGDDLLTGSRDSNLYTISTSELAASSPAQILKIGTNNGTEFKNEKLRSFYAKLGIVHNTSIARTPQQNGVVKRRNRTLVEAAHTMLIFSKSPKFFWAEAIATACFTQNLSIVHTRYNKTPYELIHGRKPNVQYFYVFGSLCYPTNNHDDLGKVKPKADIGIFIGYSKSSRGFQLGFNYTNFQDSSEDSQSEPSKTDLDNLFGSLYEEYYSTNPPEVSDNSTTNTLDNKDTSSSSSIVIEEDEAPQKVSSSAEQVVSEPNTSFLNDNVDELV
ncbi:retrovirus-related pol polyprotein from transposon TNT 1-94 [Tanacetum coccineum]|uniref:Retrovirus-related pol polyprotein from transposon TNT 1-94 n=1 Tax=Tanacetum coccineum TaxID=301880 RepID=A0ABQ4XEX5_9ASTR